MKKLFTVFCSSFLWVIYTFSASNNYQLNQSIEVGEKFYPITWVEPINQGNFKQVLESNQKEGHRQIKEAFKALIEQYMSYGVVKHNDIRAQNEFLSLADNRKSYTIVVWEPNKPRIADNVLGMLRVYISNRERPIPIVAKLRGIPRGKEEIRQHPGLYENPKAVEAAHLMSRVPNITMLMLGTVMEKIIRDIGKDAIIFAETIRQDSDRFSDYSKVEELERLPKSSQEKLYERVFMFKPQNLFVDPSFEGRVTSVLVTTAGQLQRNIEWINAKGRKDRSNIVRLDRTEALRQLNSFEKSSELRHRIQRKKRLVRKNSRNTVPTCSKVGFGLERRKGH